MNIIELSTKNTDQDVIDLIRSKFKNLCLSTIEFKCSMADKVSICFHNSDTTSLNHLLIFIGMDNDETYLVFNDYINEIESFPALEKFLTKDFLKFDEYIDNLEYNKSIRLNRLNKSASISHHVSNGLRFVNDCFEHIYIIYIENIGVFKFEKDDFELFKELLDEYRGEIF